MAWAEKLRTEGDGLTKGQRAADALAAMVAALAADGKTPTHNGHPAAATVLIPLNEAERVTDGIVRRRQALPDCTDLLATGGGSLSFTQLPMSTGRIGIHHTLGDAAARFLLCAGELTGAVVTTGHDPEPRPGRMLAALLGAAPLQPLALGRAQRFASTGQRKALEIRDGGCVSPTASRREVPPFRLLDRTRALPDPSRTRLGRRRRHRPRPDGTAVLASSPTARPRQVDLETQRRPRRPALAGRTSTPATMAHVTVTRGSQYPGNTESGGRLPS